MKLFKVEVRKHWRINYRPGVIFNNGEAYVAVNWLGYLIYIDSVKKTVLK